MRPAPLAGGHADGPRAGGSGPMMRPGAQAEPARAVRHAVELAMLADELGLDLVGIQDHPYRPELADTWSLLCYIGARTRRIRLVPASPACRCARQRRSPKRRHRSTCPPQDASSSVWARERSGTRSRRWEDPHGQSASPSTLSPRRSQSWSGQQPDSGGVEIRAITEDELGIWVRALDASFPARHPRRCPDIQQGVFTSGRPVGCPAPPDVGHGGSACVTEPADRPLPSVIGLAM